MAGHAANGGLQRHSIGELYPMIIVQYGDGKWSWINGATGEASPARYNFQDIAVGCARFWRSVLYGETS